MAYDLHTHSTRSDGTAAPAQVVRLAAEAGLTGLALTDHDTLDGWAEAEGAAKARGLDFVPGIELSAERAEASVHLLGFWADAGHDGLVAECRRLRAERARRMRAMLDRLAALGIEVDEARVRAVAQDAPIGRPHLARALVECGAAPDVETVFATLIGDGGPAYEPKRALDPVDAVRLIVDAGGVAVLAHPDLSGDRAFVEPLVDELAAAGLAGVEADHAHHDPEAAAHWRREASKRGLVATGASDFHGGLKDTRVGERTTPAEVVEALRARRPDGARVYRAAASEPQDGTRRTAPW